MSQISLPIGPRGKKISAFAKYGLLLLTGLLVAPIIMTAIGGLIGIGVAVSLYVVATALAPVFSLKLANLATKWLIAEIRENPVPSRLKVEAEKQQALDSAKTDLEDFNRGVKEYEAKVGQLKKTYPQDAAKFDGHLQNMQNLMEARYRAFIRADRGLEEYREGTKRVEAIWAVTLVSDKMTKAAKRMAAESAMTQIINDVSLQVTEDNMARSFADLDHALRMEDIQQAKMPSGVVLSSEPPLLEKAADGSFILPSLSIRSKVPTAR